MQIIYTLKSNIEEETFEVIDESLVQSIRVPEEEISTVLGSDFTLISKWDNEEYDQMQVKMKQEAKENINKELLNYLDSKALELGFTGDDKTRPYRAIANYVGFDNPFRESAEKLGVWFATVFQKVEEIESDVELNNREFPTFEEILNELPKFE